MRCISLWQPWASLWMAGLKHNETRSWAIPRLGETAVHAAKKKPSEIPGLVEMFWHEWDIWAPAMERIGCKVYHDNRAIKLDTLPFGCIIGTLDVYKCTLISERNAPPKPEREFGDYSPGRFAWSANNCRPVSTPIPFRGSQGFFNLPTEIAERIRVAEGLA